MSVLEHFEEQMVCQGMDVIWLIGRNIVDRLDIMERAEEHETSWNGQNIAEQTRCSAVL